MSNNISVESILESVKAEGKKIEMEKTASTKSLVNMVSGGTVSEQAEEANIVAAKVAEEVGVESISLSDDLEKFASEIDKAETSSDIIKIAEDVGNSDLANLSKVASKITGVIFEELESRLSE
jgi:regulatory protein YycI of two-component signal transduction system YycFG